MISRHLLISVRCWVMPFGDVVGLECCCCVKCCRRGWYHVERESWPVTLTLTIGSLQGRERVLPATQYEHTLINPWHYYLPDLKTPVSDLTLQVCDRQFRAFVLHSESVSQTYSIGNVCFPASSDISTHSTLPGNSTTSS